MVSLKYEVTATDSKQPAEHYLKIKHLRIVFGSLIVAFGSLAAGTAISYPSPAIPDMNSRPNALHMNKQEQSWFGSLFMLAGLPAAVISGYIMDINGRKMTVLLGAIPIVTGWILISTGAKIWIMYLGICCLGFGFTIATSVTSVYISEIAPASMRGLLLTFHTLGINVGGLFVYVVGTYLAWNWLAIVCLSLTVIQVIILVFLPESPRWLVFQNLRLGAAQSLSWYHGSNVDVQKEIQEIERGLSDCFNPLPWLDYIRKPHWKSLLISQFSMAIHQLSGRAAIKTYTVTIFQASGTSLNPNVETNIIGAVMVLAAVAFAAIADKFERRSLFLFSGITSSLSLAAAGTYFLIESHDPEFAKEHLQWLPLTALILFSFFVEFGFTSIPYIITSELFPTRARSRASAMAFVNLAIFGFLGTKLFMDISASKIGIGGALYICSGICFFGATIVFFVMPLTKDKTLEQIQQQLGQ